MKKRGPLFALFLSLTLLLSGCSSLTVLDPKGPAARTLSETIILSIIMMLGVLAVVYVLFVFMLVKYRAKKSNEGYVPPHEEGSKWLEITWITIPIIIVAFLSVVTVKTTVAVENVPEGYEDQKPLVIYASSSDWKWHFSYPEEGIETVNYVNIPTNRPIEFRNYSFGPITSLWIPQLAGQKYAMSDMLTKLNLVADVPGSYIGKNSNFSGEGFAHMEFETLAMTPAEFDEWVKDVKETAPELTETEFNKLLETDHVGRMSFSNNHLTFSPPPAEHGHHGNAAHQENGTEHSDPDSEHNDNPDEHSSTNHEGH
ncbi:cytochrome aa3 quinol oxidase subunit 2 [Paenibacillus uliginis N3/975]|uniref:Quinol oxidase subunit 2 n=1 Tax=Paenibacillus uliginis N3/975 TaxID=1313296 RepID=A0A1X7HGQ4_9BACL|nr:cytochrome aa3 quinol oxidase subunit II [Paenibacillus uliginis]SMF86047.1 cytochrome aa3 quinol oxidase subunit 2 [Paenibacillus uliginis N3/975]